MNIYQNNKGLQSPSIGGVGEAVVAGCMRWGKWGANFNTTQYQSLIEQYLEAGINTFDHADIYGHYTTEKEFGEALKNNASLRSQIKIITKCGIQLVCNERPNNIVKHYNTSKQYIIESVNQSLQNFNTDYINVLLIHRPSPLIDVVEIAEAIAQLKQEGKILEFGVSNFLPFQVDSLRKHINISYNQVEVSLANTTTFTNGVLNNCIDNKITPMAWGCLGLNENNVKLITVLESLATKYKVTKQQIQITFVLQHPSKIIPVIGSTKIERLIEAQNAYQINLDVQDWFLLYEATHEKEVD